MTIVCPMENIWNQNGEGSRRKTSEKTLMDQTTKKELLAGTAVGNIIEKDIIKDENRGTKENTPKKGEHNEEITRVSGDVLITKEEHERLNAKKENSGEKEKEHDRNDQNKETKDKHEPSNDRERAGSVTWKKRTGEEKSIIRDNDKFNEKKEGEGGSPTLESRKTFNNETKGENSSIMTKSTSQEIWKRKTKRGSRIIQKKEKLENAKEKVDEDSKEKIEVGRNEPLGMRNKKNIEIIIREKFGDENKEKFKMSKEKTEAGSNEKMEKEKNESGSREKQKMDSRENIKTDSKEKVNVNSREKLKSESNEMLKVTKKSKNKDKKLGNEEKGNSEEISRVEEKDILNKTLEPCDKETRKFNEITEETAQMSTINANEKRWFHLQEEKNESGGLFNSKDSGEYDQVDKQREHDQIRIDEENQIAAKAKKKISVKKTKATSKVESIVKKKQNHDPSKRPKLARGVFIKTEIQKYRVRAILGSGGFGDVYKVRIKAKHRKDAKAYAMKTETTNFMKKELNRLKMEMAVLQEVAKLPEECRKHFVSLIDRGRTEDFKFIIMDLVGISLDTLQRKTPSRHFSFSTSILLGIETLEGIQDLHSIGYLHRDIKPQNFSSGYKERSNLIYILDFGIARRFTEKRSKVLRLPREKVRFLGTVRYASRSCHLWREQCRKDDLESWVYMLVEFTNYSSLPWSKMIEKNRVLMEKHKFFSGSYSPPVARLPIDIHRIIHYVDRIKFEDTPDYLFMSSLLRKAAKRKSVDLTDKFDWLQEKPRHNNC